ncbi:hypothetical protein QP735_04430 [Curtobacterium citreum]|uniref:hypothetical protein n=1 Tax=Curtobacterium citreum TaxID=2036 RepID=UPI00254BAE61|nr:hypothetical protein [Curtobacterium citreum]MDK8171770.1 hypothetical protein [Curtobacterium citreum]
MADIKRILVRRDTLANWTGVVPANGEPIGIIADDPRVTVYKIGDGVTSADQLPALSKGDKGPEGQPGRDGLPGANAVPTQNAFNAYAQTVYPLGNGQDDSAQINQALATYRRVTLLGTFLIGATLYVPSATILDARGAKITALPGWAGAMLSAASQQQLVGSPRNLTLTSSTTGSLPASTYYYSVTAVTATGETMVAPTKKTSIGATGSVTLSWDALPSATSYRVWRGATGRLQLLGTTTGVSFNDDGSASLGAEVMPERNSTFGRTAGVGVLGGDWNVNGTNRPASGQWPTQGYWAGHGFDFQHVDDLVLDGCIIRDAPKWGVAVADFGNIRTDNLIFDTGSDGIHVLGPGTSWSADNVRAIRTGDDTFGISLAEWANYAVSRGSIGSVRITNARQELGHSFVRVLGADGYKIGSLTIDGVSGNYSGQFRGGIYLWDNADGTSWPSRTVVDQVSISNVDAVMTDTPVAPSPYGGKGQHGLIVLSGAKFAQVNLKNVRGRTVTGSALAAVVEVGGSDLAGPMQIDSFVAEQVRADCAMVSPYGVITFRENAQIASAVVRECTFNDATTNGQVVKVFGATCYVKALTVIAPHRMSYDTVGAAMEVATSARVGQLTVQSVNDVEAYRIVEVYAGTQVDAILIDTVSNPLGYVQELVRIASSAPCVVTLRNLSLPSIAHELVRARSGASVTVLSAGGVDSGTTDAASAEAGYTSLRLNGADLLWSLGNAKLTPRIGDQLRNRSTVNAGAGIVITDGTTWKNMYSGTTWTNA